MFAYGEKIHNSLCTCLLWMVVVGSCKHGDVVFIHHCRWVFWIMYKPADYTASSPDKRRHLVKSKWEERMNTWEVEVFFDGECPLCVREINMMKRLDRKQRIRFTDIASPTFRAKAYGRDMDDFMSRMQGRLPGGEWIEGVEVFRRLYGAIGLRWLIPLTRLPGISHLLDAAYTIFAKNRLRWTGRCDSDTCEIPADSVHSS